MSRFSSTSGLTRVELLVLAGVLMLLAAGALGPGWAYFEQSRINRGVESARTLDTTLNQYATDNNGVYPIGEGTPAAGKSEGIALNLLRIVTRPTPPSSPSARDRSLSGKASDYSDIAAANIGWDFTAGATATIGLTRPPRTCLPPSTAQAKPCFTRHGGHGTRFPTPGHRPFRHERHRHCV